MVNADSRRALHFLLASLLAATATSAQSIPAPANLEAWLPVSTTDFVQGTASIQQNGMAGCAPGVVGQAIALNGPGDSVRATYPQPIAIGSGDFTVECWVYWHPDLNPGAGNVIVRDKTSLRLDTASFSSKLHAHLGGQIAYSFVDLPAERWVHLAFVRRSSLTEFYVDSAFVGYGKSFGGGPIISSEPIDFSELQIGGDGAGWFGGLVDEVSVYSRALSPEEIQAIYGSGSAGKEPPFPSIDLVRPPSVILGNWHSSFFAGNSRFETNSVWRVERLTKTGNVIRTVAAEVDGCGPVGVWSAGPLTPGYYRVTLGIQNDTLGVVSSWDFQIYGAISWGGLGLSYIRIF